MFRDKHISGCRQAIMDAVKRKRDSGELSFGDAVRFRTAFSLFPRKMSRYCEDVVLPEAMASVPAAFRMEGSVVGEIDWDSLADFIERILPVVLEFIKQLLPLFVSLLLPFLLVLSAGSASAQVPDVFGGPCGGSTRQGYYVAAQDCPNGQCPLVRKAAKVVAAPSVVVARTVTAPVRAAKVQRSHQDLVKLHNSLHNGGPESPNWTWPGDLAEHLRTAHGVQLEATATRSTVAAPASSCPGGVCPVQQSSGRRRLFGRRR